MVSSTGSAVNVQPHNGSVRAIRVFGNTMVAAGSGVSITGGSAAYTQQVMGNAVFAATPISAIGATANITDSFANAANYLNSPSGALGQLDLFPKPGALRGTAIDVAGVASFSGSGLDFNGRARDWSLRGAYSGEGANPGWLPRIDVKPQ